MVSASSPALIDGLPEGKRVGKNPSEVATQTYVCRVLGRHGVVRKLRVAHAIEGLSGKHLALPPA